MILGKFHHDLTTSEPWESLANIQGIVSQNGQIDCRWVNCTNFPRLLLLEMIRYLKNPCCFNLKCKADCCSKHLGQKTKLMKHPHACWINPMFHPMNSASIPMKFPSKSMKSPCLLPSIQFCWSPLIPSISETPRFPLRGRSAPRRGTRTAAWPMCCGRLRWAIASPATPCWCEAVQLLRDRCRDDPKTDFMDSETFRTFMEFWTIMDLMNSHGNRFCRIHELSWICFLWECDGTGKVGLPWKCDVPFGNDWQFAIENGHLTDLTIVSFPSFPHEKWCVFSFQSSLKILEGILAVARNHPFIDGVFPYEPSILGHHNFWKWWSPKTYRFQY